MYLSQEGPILYRKSTKLAFILVLLAVPVKAENLDSALEYFYKTNPDVLLQSENLKAQNEAYAQARAAFGPQVSVNFETNYQQARIDQTSIFGQKYVSNLIGRTATTSLDISQPIFSGGRLTAQVNGAQADVLAAREAARAALSQAFRDAIRAYADVVRDRVILQATQQARDQLEHDLSDMQERFKAGAAAVSDRAEILARLAAARAQVASAEGQLRQSRAAYLNIIGQEPVDIPSPAPLPALPATREASVAAALQDAPTLKQAIFEEASARARVAMARANFSPNFSLRLSAQSLPLDQYLSTQQDRNLTAGLVVQAPVFTSGDSASKLRQAETQDRGARLKIESARRSVVQAAEQAFAAFETTTRTVSLFSEQVRADRVAYESLNEQFKSGLISTIDLLNSEQELASAQISLAGAEHDGVLAQADLLAASGRLEADVLIPEAEPRNPEADFRKLRLVASRFPTTMLVREFDSLAPISAPRVRHVPAEPLEAPPAPDRPAPPLDDIDPARLDSAEPLKEGPR